MSFFGRRPLKPESDEEKKLAETPNGIRVLLNRHARENSLTNYIFNLAHHQGLSGEDKYTMLAYHALLQLEHYRNTVLRIGELSPSPVFMLPIDSGADKKDAARYRCLRASFQYTGRGQHSLHWYLPRMYDGKPLAEQLDAAVDMAISSKP